MYVLGASVISYGQFDSSVTAFTLTRAVISKPRCVNLRRMNALYVTVSVPLLLILAGFNHAHGLTTFGKTQNNNHENPKTTVQAKPCATHPNCQGVNGTSCVSYHNNQGKFCLCGNNEPPYNGICAVAKKGPNHLCTTDEECVRGAQCEQSKKENVKICLCLSNPNYKYDCNGASLGNTISVSVLVLAIVCKIVY
ncbi:hypothetical protein AMK59_6509 [Oryctes borbonicus]|uniref:EGF-like domain-containing protein n=1 Tax=Oryctes borbonicus TaxID=1629725 RepID=A0A0T6AUV9_9SCAR|nr:hypothetical protein AMK59_6509 [Oryctes borbonicus]